MKSTTAEMNGARFPLSDLFGMGVSVLCLFHCLVVPLLALPALAGGLFGLEGHAVHIGAVVIAGLAALFAFSSGWRAHHKVWVVALGGAGMLVMAGALVMPESLHDLEPILTLVGGVILITAHTINLKQRRDASCSC